MEFHKIDNKSVDGPFAKRGFIPIPLVNLRKVVSNDITLDMQMNNALVHHDIPLATMRSSTGTIPGGLQTAGYLESAFVPLEDLREVFTNAITNIAANGGVLASDTTPILQYQNGDTDSALDLNWATSNVDPVIFSLGLPADLDASRDISINVFGLCVDTNVMNCDTYFDEGDTKVEDDTAAFAASAAWKAATVAAADVPSGARRMTVELTPAAHGSNAMIIDQIRIDYYRVSQPELIIANADTDGNLYLQWPIADVTPVVFKVALPRTLDASIDMTLYLRGESLDSNDTPVMDLDIYFDEGDSKVSDATSAITAAIVNATATIAAADIPAGAQTMTVEMTLGTHASDAIVVYAAWLEYRVAASDPALSYANGDTDSSHRLRWALAEVSPVSFSVPLPPDFDTNDPLYVKAWGVVGGSTDDPVIDIDTYFNIGDTKVSDAFEAFDNVAAEYSATIAAADIPDVARVVSIEMTPAAHGTDTLDIHALWLEYTKL